jgi:hypothetical protein
MQTAPSLASLFLFFVGLGVCFWRAPYADRRHLMLCLLAGALWCTLPLFEPSMRRPGYGFVVASFLIIGLTQPLRDRLAQR